MGHQEGRTVVGVGVSPGRAVGPVVHMPPSVPEPPAGRALAHGDQQAEVDRLTEASTAVRSALQAAVEHARDQAREVLETTAMMAADPSLLSAATDRVTTGATAERAVWEAAAEVMAELRALGGPLAERARDVADVRDRLVAHLMGLLPPGVPVRAEPFVLVAEDLAPVDAAGLDPERVLALVTAAGGPTSHTAVLARALGLPAVVAAPGARDLPEGEVVAVDGGAGTVLRRPDDAEQARARRAVPALPAFDGEGRTRDGHRVPLLANVGNVADARAAAAVGAEGAGLVRTEFLFLERQEAPSVQDQAAVYRGILDAFAGRPVTFRTLDAGSDKPLPFLTADDEPNPALGVRGWRTTTAHPQVLEDQLAAIALAAGPDDDVRVMAPMVSVAAEARDLVARCAAHGLSAVGVMVEVPAAALRSADLLTHATFASIGTNDLTQYAMAADRLQGSLAALADSWQPAVLDLVAATCAGARTHGRDVGVCGEAAADPALAVVLVGLGVHSLSMTARALPAVAAVLGAVDLARCTELADRARATDDAGTARAVTRADLADVLEPFGL